LKGAPGLDKVIKNYETKLTALPEKDDEDSDSSSQSDQDSLEETK